MNPALLPLALAVPTAAVYGYLRLRTIGSDPALRSLARPRDLQALTPKQVRRTAQRLRTLDRQPHMRQCGVRLGRLQPNGPDLYAGWEDSLIAFNGPLVGWNTTALAVPAVLDAPG